MCKRLIINDLCILLQCAYLLEHEVVQIAFSNRCRAFHELNVWNMIISLSLVVTRFIQVSMGRFALDL